MKKCPMCGNENDDIAKTCMNCGAKLETRPELELKPDTPKTAKPEITSQNTPYFKPGPQDPIMVEILNRTANIDKNVSAIKGWVTFLGIIVLIIQILGLISSCGVMLGL